MVDKGERMRMSAVQAGRTRRRLGGAVLPTVTTLLVVALGASGCAGTAAAEAAPDELTAPLQEWAELDEAGQRASLDADLRDLGAIVIEAAGLPEIAGMDAAAIEAALTRFAMPTRPEPTAEAAPAPAEPAAPAEGPSPEDMLEDAGLGDVDLGGLEGMTPEEIAQLTPEELAELVGGGAGGGSGGGAGYPTGSDDSARTTVSAASAAVRPAVAAVPASVAAPRAEQAPTSALTAQGAAFDAASTIIDDLAYALEKAGASGTQSTTYEWSTDDLVASGSVKEGLAITGMEYTLFDEVGGVSVQLDSTLDSNVQVCPDEEGRVMGQFKVTGTLHSADASGAPLMTRVTMNVGLDVLVDDEAWASSSTGDYDAEIETGRPTPGGEFAQVLVKEANSGTVSVDYYSGGANGSKIAKVGVKNARGSGPLGSMGRDVAAKVQQGALKAIQQYWRLGNCVTADVKASPADIPRGGTSELTVVAIPVDGGRPVPGAKAEYTGVNSGSVQGKITPGSKQEAPAQFSFIAEENDGMAVPEFRVVSNRGIGTGIGIIRVGQAGWAVDWTGANGERITGVKCDGIPGTWELTGTSDYTWGGSAVMEIGEDLSGTITWTASVTADQVYDFAGTRPVSFEARAGGYLIITPDGELPVRKATSSECG